MTVDTYVIDVLMRDLISHDRSPSAFIVFIHLYRHTHGSNRSSVHQSHQQIAEATGLSKTAVQGAVRRLLRRKLLAMKRAHRTARPEYVVHRPWAS
jgi:predicted transcriptional regulator